MNTQGKVSISNTVTSIRNIQTTGLQVFSTSSSSVKAAIETTEAGMLQYQLISMSGQVCSRGAFKALVGLNQMDLDISRLPAGKYQLVLHGKGVESSVPVLKKY